MSEIKRDNVRFLPAEDADHEGTQVALSSSHITRVYDVSPEDGKRGTWIHPRFRKAAIAAGCSIVGIGDHEEPEGDDGSKLALIVVAIEKLVETNAPETLDNEGKPKLAAVKKTAGIGITKTELDAAWAKFVAGLDD
ncbi:hypothetical protein ACM74F_05360 [Pseudomonas aeruginosa]|uniref:hypothetical protein n=1 Tax=Pseudomonas aeruginosa TaxID=287 RepID=UPI00053EF8DC|nr:hypothetical protein [Pseudomonas aeruginosa]EMB0054127.1 hypothetical protein [Pseudomonas aeruginosa]MCG3059114.1 hypothetical protein [Pseudomonas aeruginosa]MCG3070178.1 hypothetical protein [Pseudomonas aeruginosa]MCG3082089.1 hypothetical protein [Pseudomonas aeruginosa]MCO3228734.1 hypothetical protein [Pseudomonas aeruginosa]